MNDEEVKLAMEQRNTPRFKNIAGCNLDLREPDGTVIETIKPGQVVVGDKYLPFVGDGLLGPLKWLNKPKVDDRKVVFDTSKPGGK